MPESIFGVLVCDCLAHGVSGEATYLNILIEVYERGNRRCIAYSHAHADVGANQ